MISREPGPVLVAFTGRTVRVSGRTAARLRIGDAVSGPLTVSKIEAEMVHADLPY